MLRDLSEMQVRLLTTERVSETLEEIYGRVGMIVEVLSTHAKADGTIERVARFRVRKSSRVVLVGRSKMFVEPLRAELDGAMGGLSRRSRDGTVARLRGWRGAREAHAVDRPRPHRGRSRPTLPRS